ncbi:hypothetical protein QBC35DRAFT_517856 [Podospora australis]|uniref:G domain-containing protein n=1 Tax=Podospora australis TaxID=1536484 RepID=A0AAN6WPE1_9PEZI|nr:hypothetical protein QBC35DRAFT_517856 [Podospora australis]
MGITGAGKSSFIATCSGKEVAIGNSLQACTSQVDVFAYEMTPDRTVYLIDTPGFDDTNRSDTGVLTEIARWLGDSYRSKILLYGIIYLHRITDVRMTGSARRNLLMFKQLCGDNYLKKVILVTTMWGKGPTRVAVDRERELVDAPEFWGSMISKGSKCSRYYNNAVSGRNIIHKLTDHGSPIATELQKELVDESRELGQTSAGQEVAIALQKKRLKWAEERRKIEERIEEAKRNALRVTMESLLAERDTREAQLKQQMMQQQQAHEDAMRRVAKKQELQVSELQSVQKRLNHEVRHRKGPCVSQGVSSTNAGIYARYTLTIFESAYPFTEPNKICR